jgi:hypothetical protein
MNQALYAHMNNKRKMKKKKGKGFYKCDEGSFPRESVLDFLGGPYIPS